MEDQKIHIDTAKLAKEAEFNEPCTHFYIIGKGSIKRSVKIQEFGNYHDDDKLNQFCKIGKGQPHLALAPTQSLLQRWLREVHNIHVNCFYSSNPNIMGYVYGVIESEAAEDNLVYDTYEEAFEVGLWEALKYLLSKKNIYITKK